MDHKLRRVASEISIQTPSSKRNIQILSSKQISKRNIQTPSSKVFLPRRVEEGPNEQMGAAAAFTVGGETRSPHTTVKSFSFHGGSFGCAAGPSSVPPRQNACMQHILFVFFKKIITISLSTNVGQQF